MSSKSSSKATKKRKTGAPDRSQPKLDHFLSPSAIASPPIREKDDPMQVDSEPSKGPKSHLGFFRQQPIVPTITISNANPTRQKELSDKDFISSWETQRVLILDVFSNRQASMNINYIQAAQLTESLGRFGKFAELYMALKNEIVKHVQQLKAQLLAVNLSQDLLQRLNLSWDTFCSQLAIIRNVFMELDRVYILPNTKFSSIIQLGKHIFSEKIMDASEFRDVVVAQVLQLIKNDRDGQAVDIGLIHAILHMLIELSYYSTDFEPKFLAHTNRYYKEESSRLIVSMSIPEYIQHAYQRKAQESEQRIKNYLDMHTKQALSAAVTNQLVYSQAEVMIEKGFADMMDNNLIEPLRIFYGLLEQSPKISLLRQAFGEYIKSHGVALIRDPKLDQSMITSLLTFKRKLDKILKNCFNDDVSFVNTLKEGFEYFINTRGNKPAELLAKFIDSKLKITKKRNTGNNEAESPALDNSLVFFRYIQSKDAFEVYYKRFLAKRLLLDRSSSHEAENRVLEKLKLECGHEFTKNLENMFSDIQVSTDLNNEFKEFSPEEPRLPIQVKVIAQATWPTYPISKMRLPADMISSQELYEKFYTKKFNGRKLDWQNTLSSCLITAHFPKGQKEVLMSLSQAVILLMFNNKRKKSISYSEIQTATGLDKKELFGCLSSLSTGAYKLLINESGKDTISVGDKFKYNVDYQSNNVRLRIPAASFEQAVEEEKGVEQKVHINRQHQLEAAIVRIMKSKRTLSHTVLVNEIFTQLKYPVDASDIKKRIESLIDRDYLARDTEDGSVYIYQS